MHKIKSSAIHLDLYNLQIIVNLNNKLKQKQIIDKVKTTKQSGTGEPKLSGAFNTMIKNMFRGRKSLTKVMKGNGCT